MSTCISSHGEYSAHTPDDTYVCTRCAVLDEDRLRDELKNLRADNDFYREAITADAEGYRKASLTLKRQRDKVLTLIKAFNDPIFPGSVFSVASEIRAIYSQPTPDGWCCEPCKQLAGAANPLRRECDSCEATKTRDCRCGRWLCDGCNCDCANAQPAPTSSQTWEQGDGGGVPDDGTEHAKPEPEKALRDHNGKIWVLSSGKLHLAGWQHGIEPIDLDNMTPLVELPPDDEPQFVYCQHCPSMAKLIVGLVYRCPLCLNETTEPVDAPPLASGGVVDSSKAYVVGEERDCGYRPFVRQPGWDAVYRIIREHPPISSGGDRGAAENGRIWLAVEAALDAMDIPEGEADAQLPLAVEGCVCSTTAHDYNGGWVYELNADADCPVHGEKTMADLKRITAIADARRDVIDKAKAWRAWWATVHQVDGSMFIPENDLAVAVDVLARVEEADHG